MGKSKFSTVIITDKHSNGTKVYSINQKYIENITLYKKVLLFSSISILSLLIALFSYIGYGYYQKEALHGKIVDLENKLDNKKLNQMINNLNEAEKTLEKIENYLSEREIKTFSYKSKLNENVGGEHYPVNHANVDLVKTTKERMTDLLNKIQSVPTGVPYEGGRLSSSFGVRGNPFNNKGAEFHSGLDFAGNMGDPINVTANGKVVFAGVKGGYGNCIIVKHGFGYETLYGHLSKINVKEGQSVKTGDIIGALGSTGRSTGPHLHYEVIYNKGKENPNNFLQIK